MACLNWSQNLFLYLWVLRWVIWSPEVSVNCACIRGSDTTTPSSWMHQMQQVTQYTWLSQHKLPSTSVHASWLADHIQQERKLCSPFSRQLVLQTSQALYKQCWLIFASVDVYVIRPANSLHGLNSWPWNNWLIFFYCSSFMGPHWDKVAIS